MCRGAALHTVEAVTVGGSSVSAKRWRSLGDGVFLFLQLALGTWPLGSALSRSP
jgi:hypothetical protein